MKILLEPQVRIIARPQFIEHPDYKLPVGAEDSNPVNLGAFAAKLCYDSFGVNGRPNAENQRAIMQHAHGSVLEHLHYSLFIEGITRGLSLELNRHRTWNISQRSTRYTKEEDAAIVLEPYFASIFKKYNFREIDGMWVADVEESDDREKMECLMVHEHIKSAAQSFDSYATQIKMLEALNPLGLTGFDLRKFARGKARNSLPHGLETRGTYTNNIRGLRWFVEARSSRHAEPEIRVLANMVLSAMMSECPLYFEDFKSAGVYDGIEEFVPQYRKV